jgi:hypothetical protein
MWPQAFLLLLSAGAIGGTGAVALIAAFKGKTQLMRSATVAGSIAGVGYVLLVAGVAAAAPERTLALGEEKYICELDCHLAYSVAGVRRQGDSLVVRLNIRFDRATISSRRSLDMPLHPGGRIVRLRDGNQVDYPAVSLGDLRRALRPGEGYQTELVFDVDPKATELILYIADADPTKMVLIGSDNALLRTPVGFRLSGK